MMLDYLSEDVNVSLRYDFTESWIGKLEYHNIRGKGQSLGQKYRAILKARWKTSDRWDIFWLG